MNGAIADGFSEGLNATLGAFSGSSAGLLSGSGAINNLAAGLADGTSLLVTLNTSATGLVRNLSATADLREAARNLFAMLHELDVTAQKIAIAPIPETGLGEAINDRLKRAAAPRH
jgi:hypothetical protein